MKMIDMLNNKENMRLGDIIEYDRYVEDANFDTYEFDTYNDEFEEE